MALGLMVPRLGILTPETTPLYTTAGWVIIGPDGSYAPSEAPE